MTPAELSRIRRCSKPLLGDPRAICRRHSLRRLLLVSPETPLKRIMTPDPMSVRVDMDQEEVARLVASYNLLAIPVVEESNKLVGVITVDDVIDVIKDEATEDLYRLAGVSSDERVFTPAAESLRKRMPCCCEPGTAFCSGSSRVSDTIGAGFACRLPAYRRRNGAPPLPDPHRPIRGIGS